MADTQDEERAMAEAVKDWTYQHAGLEGRLCQDEVGKEVGKLSKWFASRLDARAVIRRFFGGKDANRV